jgi:uncharacterized damage-inducible protein DinB
MKEHYVNTIKNSEIYTHAVAEAMPENKYKFAPTDGVWNFGELINHIAYGITWWTNNYIKKEEMPWDPPKAKTNKKEILTDLKNAYDYLRTSLNNGTVTEEKINGLYATLDHITHHRGQAATYLRLNGITPPDYTY